MAYPEVKFVDDDALPEETDWALARCDGGRAFLFIKRGLCAGGCGPCGVLAEAREAWIRLTGDHSSSIITPRVSSA